MRLRLLLLGLVLGALLAGTPYVAVSDSSSYATSSASLRTLWATDIAQGLLPSDLAPLRSELDPQSASTFLGVPTLSLNPMRSQAEFLSLRTRTDALYAFALAIERNHAYASRDLLATAVGSPSTLQLHLWRQDLAAAVTINDYRTLADAWHLDALLVPLDRSLATQAQLLQALLAQATALQLTDPTAAHSWSPPPLTLISPPLCATPVPMTCWLSSLLLRPPCRPKSTPKLLAALRLLVLLPPRPPLRLLAPPLLLRSICPSTVTTPTVVVPLSSLAASTRTPALIPPPTWSPISGQ